ncbi:MAG: DNRLRE domain-containing protein, partial [Planctomycetota bacterium]|nr:DNRLRE domain-containing protein [Planctomycetota bacterium]
ALVQFNAPIFDGDVVLTMKDAVRDLSGKQFDGNGDGIAGGNYTFTLDVGAPLILAPATTTGQGEIGDVAALTGGRWVVINEDSNTGKLLARRYDAGGSQLGEPIVVNGATNLAFSFYNREGPAVAALTGGGFVATWTAYIVDAATGAYDRNVVGRRYDAAGVAAGPEFLVNTATQFDQSNPDVAATTDGGFAFVWRGASGTGPSGSSIGNDIYARRYSAAGAALGGAFLVNANTTAGEQEQPSAAGLSGGGLVIVWSGSDAGATSTDVYARRYDATGAAIGVESMVSATTIDNHNPVVAALGGGYAVAWSADDAEGFADIFVRRFSAAGAALGEATRANVATRDYQTEPTIAPMPLGGFVVGWSSRRQDGTRSGYYGRRFTGIGAANGGEFRVSDITTSWTNEFSPAIAVAPDGQAMATWMSRESSSGGNYNVRRLDLLPQGPLVGTPFAFGATAAVTIQAEDYDLGGEGVAFHETTANNIGNVYRNEAVDVKLIANTTNQYRLSDAAVGEWVEYSILANDAGNYELELRLSNADPNAKVHVEIDGVNVTGSLAVPDTNSFSTFASVKKQFAIAQGAHVLRLAFDVAAVTGSVAGVDWMKLTPAPVTPPPPAGGTIITNTATYVRNGTYASQNFGTAADLIVKRSGTSGNTREIYLKFDLTSLSSLSTAKLRLNGRLSDTTNASVLTQVFSASDTSWSEGGLSWNNKPAASTTVRGSLTVSGTGSKWYEVDLSSFLKAEFAASRKIVTLVLKNPNTSNAQTLFASDETANGPRLVIT